MFLRYSAVTISSSKDDPLMEVSLYTKNVLKNELKIFITIIKYTKVIQIKYVKRVMGKQIKEKEAIY